MITKIVPPAIGCAMWHGEAISPRQHYRWFAYPGERCSVQSGKLSDGPVVSSNGTK